MRLVFLDKFTHKYTIEVIEDITSIDHLVSQISKEDYRLAMDGYPERLIWSLNYTPKQALERVPNKRCVLYNGCISYIPKCLNLNKNPCLLLQMPDDKGDHDAVLTHIINAWRDGCYVVRLV